MDEFEVISAWGGNPSPTPEVTARHRGQLRAALRTETEASVPSGPPREMPVTGHGGAPVVELDAVRRPSGRRRWLAAVAAAAALVLGGAALSRIGPGEATEAVSATRPDDATPDPGVAGGPGPELACGTELPVDISLPGDYRGPIPGPGGDAATDPEPGQFVEHWAAPSGTVEVRWPADTEQAARTEPWDTHVESDASDATRNFAAWVDGSGHVTEVGANPTPSGRAAIMSLVTATSASEGCESLQILVTDTDLTRAEHIATHITAHLFDSHQPPLVIGHGEAGSAPAVDRCRAPAGIPVPPNQGGQVTAINGFASSTAALEAFLDTQDTLTQGGYQELTLPDRSIAYTFEPEPGFIATVVHIVEHDDGWTVTDWAATGC